MKKSRRLLDPADPRIRIKALPSGSGLQKNNGGNKLAGKMVFLDIADARQAKTVELKLRKLKAVIETFLTKEVNYVVSSSNLVKAQSTDKAAGPRSVSPAFSNTPSPFHHTPSTNASPSPTYRNAEGKLVPLSRGQAMAQLARARNRSPSPSGAVATATKLGIRIIPIEQAEKWLDKELKKRGLTISEETCPQHENQDSRRNSWSKTRQLVEPFLKVEACCQQYRPQHKELAVWPRLNVCTPPGTCPFDGVGVSVAPRSRVVSKEAAASAGPTVSPGTQSNPQRRSLEGDESAQLVGLPILTAGDLRRQKEKLKQDQRRRGYCECCHARYDDIDKHLKEPGHMEFARDKNNYEILEDLISSLPSPSQFLRNTLLRHCSEYQGEKPSTSTSIQKAEEDFSNDQVLTISFSTPTKPAQLDMEGMGYQTPTHTPQYPTGQTLTCTPQNAPGQASAAGSSSSHHQPCGAAGEQRMSQAEVGLGQDSDAEAGAKDQSRPLSAVVIRRPTARSAYGSPRDKWSHSRSPYGKDSPCTPKKMRERSMVIGNTSIGSLQSVPESLSLSGSPEDSGRPERQHGDHTEAGGSGDRSKGSVLRRQMEQSPQPSTSGTSNKQGSLSSLSQETHSPAEGGRSQEPFQRGSGSKRRRGSPAYQDTEAAAGMSTAHPRQHGEGRQIQVQVQVHSVGENEGNRKKRRSGRNTQASGDKRRSSKITQFQKESLEIETIELEQEFGQNENPVSERGNKDSMIKNGVKQICEEDFTTKHTGSGDVGLSSVPLTAEASQTAASRTHESERDESDTVQDRPGKSLRGSVMEEVQTPQKAASSAMEEEETCHSPVYNLQALTTSTPAVVPVRKLRSTQSGFLPSPGKEESPVVKSCRRTLLTEDAQPGPSPSLSAHSEATTSTGKEKSSARDKHKTASRQTEPSPSESGDSSFRSKDDSTPRRKGKHVSRKAAFRREEESVSGSEEKSAQKNKRSVSRSKETAAPSSEQSSVLESVEESAAGSKKSASKSKERSASRRKESSASKSRERESKESSGKRDRSTSESKRKRPTSQVSSETEEKKPKRRSSRLETSKPHSTSKETPREEGIVDSFCKSSCFTEGGSRHLAQMSGSNCSGQSVDEARIDCTQSLRIRLVRCPEPVETSTKKVKLNRSWQLLSDSSMSRLLKSDTENSSFHGFQGDEALPSDLTYISASEVEVTDDEDREWLIDDEEQSDPKEEERGIELLGEFIPTFSSPGKSNSSWDDACDLYVSQSVEQQLKSRQLRRSPRKAAAVQSKKRKRTDNGRGHGNSAGTVTKKRKLRKKVENEWNPQRGMHTPTKKERKNGILCESESSMSLDKEILLSYSSPRKSHSMPLSPLKMWNGEVREALLQSPKQSQASLPAQRPPPFKIQ